MTGAQEGSSVRLSPYEQWMVRQNLGYAQSEGAEVVIARLEAGGYSRVASAVKAATS